MSAQPFTYLRKLGLKHREGGPRWQSWPERARGRCDSVLVSDEAGGQEGCLAERTQEPGGCSNCK